MNIILTTKNRKYDFTKQLITNIVERKSKTVEGLVWVVLKTGDTDIARFKLEEVEGIIFKDAI